MRAAQKNHGTGTHFLASCEFVEIL